MNKMEKQIRPNQMEIALLLGQKKVEEVCEFFNQCRGVEISRFCKEYCKEGGHVCGVKAYTIKKC